MKTNLEFEKRQQPFIRPRSMQQGHESFASMPEPRVSDMPRLNLAHNTATVQPAGFKLVYDEKNPILHAAVSNLRHFFPDLFAKLEQHNVTVFLTEEDLPENILGDTRCKMSRTHENYDVVPLRKEKGKGEADSPWRKNHVYDGEIVDLNTKADSPKLQFKILEVYVKISRDNILNSLFKKYHSTFSITDPHAAQQYHATLAHELLGHAEYTLSHPEWEAKWNAIHDEMTQTVFGEGHEVFNLDGENAANIGKTVEGKFFDMIKDPAYIPF